MRNLLAFSAALVITFLTVGYFLNWYSISTNPGPDGRRSVTIDLNTKKIGQDIHSGTEKVQGMLDKTTKDQNTATQTPGQTVPVTTPSSQAVEPTGWWTPTSQPSQPVQNQNPSRRDPRSGVLPPADPWQQPRQFQEVPLTIPPVRDR